jgi:hypothetical protein
VAAQVPALVAVLAPARAAVAALAPEPEAEVPQPDRLLEPEDSAATGIP